MTTGPASSRLLPVLLVFGSALLWGIWWVPIRMLEDQGLHGVWAGFFMNLSSLPALLLALLWAMRRGAARISTRTLLGGMLFGIAAATFAGSLTLTDVVRAVLFFYLAPAWSILIEITFLGRRPALRNLLAVALSFGGMVVIMRAEVPLSGIGAVGDWLAFLSGICWSVASAVVFTGGRPSVVKLTLALVMGAVIAPLAIYLIGGPTVGAVPSSDAVLASLPLSLLSGTIYIAPMMLVTIWGAQRLNPATMSFLLTAEIISGVGTSAVFLDERFGWWELLGAALIICAALTEVVRPAHIGHGATDPVPGGGSA